MPKAIKNRQKKSEASARESSLDLTTLEGRARAFRLGAQLFKELDKDPILRPKGWKQRSAKSSEPG